MSEVTKSQNAVAQKHNGDAEKLLLDQHLVKERNGAYCEAIMRRIWSWTHVLPSSRVQNCLWGVVAQDRGSGPQSVFGVTKLFSFAMIAPCSSMRASLPSGNSTARVLASGRIWIDIVVVG